MIAPLLFVCATLGAAAASRGGPDLAEPAAPVERPAARRTAIEWVVTPGSVVVYLDGKKLGLAAGLKVTPAKPGRHTIRLTKGGDETEMEIRVVKGQRLRFVFDFSD